MTWVFVQRTGKLYGPSGTLAAIGYAGNGVDKDNPDAQFIMDHGPLPVGGYAIGAPVDGTRLGPCALPLTPDADNDMGGRSDFWIHDDSIAHPGDASDGCLVVIGESIRRTIAASPVQHLEVVAEETDVAAALAA